MADKVIIDVELRSGESKKRVDDLAAAIETLKVQRRALLKAQKDAIREFGAESEQARAAAAALNGNKVKTAALNRELRILNREIVSTGGSLDDQRARLSKLTLQYDKFAATGDKSEKELKELGREILNLTNNIKKQEASTGRFQRNVGNYTGALKNAFSSVIPAAAILTGSIAAIEFGTRALVSGVVDTVNVYKDFERQLLTLKAISGASGEQFASLEAEAKRLGGTTEFTATQVATLQTNFAKLGFNPDEILAATEATLDLATATGEDLPRAAEVAGATVRAFNLDTTETGRVVDVMAASFSGSALDLEKFSTSMRQVAPVAAAFGFSVEDTTGLLGTLANAGFDASQAGTSLRNIFLNLADPAGKLAKSLGTNITSVEELAPALKRLQESGIDVAGALELTDKRSVAAFQRFLQGSDQALELSRSLNKSEGAAAKMAGTIRDSLSGDMDTLNSSIEASQIAIGEALAPTIRVLVQALTRVVQGITSFIIGLREIPEFLKENRVELLALGSALIAFNAQAIVASANQLRLAAVQKGAAIATRAQIIAQRALNIVMTANPIGLIITGIGLLVAGFVALYNRSQTLRAGLSGFFAAINKIASNVVGALVDQFVGLKEIVAGLFTLDFDRVKAGAERTIKGIKNQYTGLGAGVADAFNKGFEDKINEEAAEKAASKLTKPDIKGATEAGTAQGKAFKDALDKAQQNLDNKNAEASGKKSSKSNISEEKQRREEEIALRAEFLRREQEIENEFLQQKLDAIRLLNAEEINKDDQEKILLEAKRNRLEEEITLLEEFGKETLQKEIELEQLKTEALEEVEEERLEKLKARKEREAEIEKSTQEVIATVQEAYLQAEQAKIDLNQEKRNAVVAASDAIIQKFGEESAAGRAAAIVQKAVAAVEVGIALQQELAAIDVAAAKISASAPPFSIPAGIAYGTARRTAAIIKAGISLARIAAFEKGGLTFEGQEVLMVDSHADGGWRNRPTLGLIGEKGPEYVIPNNLLRIPQVQSAVAGIERMRIRPFQDGGFSSNVVNQEALNLDIGGQIRDGFNNMPRQVLVVQDVESGLGESVEVQQGGNI